MHSTVRAAGHARILRVITARFVTVRHYSSMSVNVRQCLSLSITARLALSLPITACHCASLVITDHHCLSLFVTVCHCLSLFVTVQLLLGHCLVTVNVWWSLFGVTVFTVFTVFTAFTVLNAGAVFGICPGGACGAGGAGFNNSTSSLHKPKYRANSRHRHKASLDHVVLDRPCTD